MIQFGCEAWFIRKIMVVELIRRSHNPNQVLSGTFVDHMDTVLQTFDLPGKPSSIVNKPTVFLSYTGAYSWSQVVHALKQLDPQAFVWMDIFCVDQFAWTGRGRSQEMQEFRKTFMKELKDQVKAIGKTVLVLENWSSGVMKALGQIWVLWEIFNSTRAKVPFSVVVPQVEIEEFISGCLEYGHNFDQVQASLSAIDANAANAEDDVDRVAILKEMKQYGLETVNRAVISTMRGWLIQQAQDYLQAQRHTRDGPSASFLNNLSRLLHDHGQFEEALSLQEESLTICQGTLSPRHSHILTGVNNMGGIYKEMGRLDDAEESFASFMKL